jgi:hypothetical protein
LSSAKTLPMKTVMNRNMIVAHFFISSLYEGITVRGTGSRIYRRSGVAGCYIHLLVLMPSFSNLVSTLC